MSALCLPFFAPVDQCGHDEDEQPAADNPRRERVHGLCDHFVLLRLWWYVSEVSFSVDQFRGESGIVLPPLCDQCSDGIICDA